MLQDVSWSNFVSQKIHGVALTPQGSDEFFIGGAVSSGAGNSEGYREIAYETNTYDSAICRVVLMLRMPDLPTRYYGIGGKDASKRRVLSPTKR